MRDNRKKRIQLLSLLIFILILVYVASAWLLPTFSRYIKRTQDEIKAHYTALYFASTGEGKTIAIEDGIGYIDFDLRNYINENVTQRDIVYTISKPDAFYDASGNPIQNPKEYDGDLHVLDVWGNPKKVAKSTCLYDVDIVQNNGEVVSEGIYTFTYEKLGTGAKGKVHTVTCKITADEGHDPNDDQISLVVQLTKPYKEVLIINMNVSNRLITFSHKEISVFEVPFDKVYVQTADLFAYHKQNTSGDRTNPESSINNYHFTSYAFKLSIKWSGYILDEMKLEDIHMGTSSSVDKVGSYDTVDPSGNVNDSGTSPNDDTGPYIDIKKSTIAFINSELVDGNHQGELIIYVPQGSDIFFHFLKAADAGSIDVKIEAYVFDDESDEYKYVLYDEELGGYTHTDKYYNLFNYEK